MHASVKYGDRDFDAQGKDHHSQRPHPAGDPPFQQTGHILHYFVEGAGHKAWHDQPDALFDPDPQQGAHTAHINAPQLSPLTGREKQDGAADIEEDGRPDPGHQSVLAVQPKVEILGGGHVMAAGVELGKHFGPEQEEVEQHGHAHDRNQSGQGLVAYVEVGEALNRPAEPK